MIQLETVSPGCDLAMMTTTGRSIPEFKRLKFAIVSISNLFPAREVPANFRLKKGKDSSSILSRKQHRSL